MTEQKAQETEACMHRPAHRRYHCAICRTWVDPAPFSDRPPLRAWMAHGTHCAIVRAPGGYAINGYVKVPKSMTVAMSDQVQVHGGVTFHSEEWIGFDTLHGGDIWPDEPNNLRLPRHDWDRHWTEEQVIAETERMAAEVRRVMEQ